MKIPQDSLPPWWERLKRINSYVFERPWLIGIIASIALITILISLSGEISLAYLSGRKPTPVIAPPQAINGQFSYPETARQPHMEQPLVGSAVSSTSFTLLIEPGLYDDHHTAIRDELDRAFVYVKERFGINATAPFTVGITLQQDCQLHGSAYTEDSVVQVFSCNAIDYRRAVAILAHEFAHQFEYERYGAAHLTSDLALSEGFATWAAGSYWLGGQPNFRAYVRNQQAAGKIFPMATGFANLDIASMNALYYQWASFVEFLIETYGRDAFDRLYVTGQSAPGSAAYAQIYDGKSLEVLEQEWLVWLNK
jgi:hypothetical protein